MRDEESWVEPPRAPGGPLPRMTEYEGLAVGANGHVSEPVPSEIVHVDPGPERPFGYLEVFAVATVIGCLAAFGTDMSNDLAPPWVNFDRIDYLLTGLLAGTFAIGVRRCLKVR